MQFSLGFFMGAAVIAITSLYIVENARPEIKHEEIYRFCLAKNIKLEECVIPDRANKGE